MSRKWILVAAVALAPTVSGCGAPRSVRALATATAPFVVATHGSVPGVERAFAAQTTRTAEELALYDARRRAKARAAADTELLWALRRTAPDQRSTGLMERIRRDDALLRNPPPAAAVATLPRVRADAGLAQITKLTELLKTVSTSKPFDPKAAVVFGKQSWKELKALDADAQADAQAP